LFDESAAAGLISERFTGRELAAFQSCALPAMQADYFRYCAVLALGGIYSDVDFSCARPLDWLLDGPQLGRLFLTARASRLLMNGFFAFSRPGNPFLRLTLEVATKLIELRTDRKVGMVTGPGMFTAAFELCKAGSTGAFLDAVHERRPALLRWADAICGAADPIVGSAAAALDHIVVDSFACLDATIHEPAAPLPYTHGKHGWRSTNMQFFR
jgi:mannosyltransferase OCH1-like enzyme